MRGIDRSPRLGLGLGALALVFGGAITGWYGAPVPSAAGDEGAKVTPVFAYDLPISGAKMPGSWSRFAPGASSPPHHHAAKGSVVGYVLEGAIRSKVDDGPVTVYEAGESWLEPPGAAHSVSANASASEPARRPLVH